MIVKVTTPTAHHIVKVKEGTLSSLLHYIEARKQDGYHFLMVSDTLAIAVNSVESIEDVTEKETVYDR